MEIDTRHAKLLKLLGEELDSRFPLVARLDRYHAGYPDIPEHVKEIKQETEYRILMRQAVTNWPELIVDSVEERLEVVGFDFGNEELNDKAWDLWQSAERESGSGPLHEATLTDGRAFVIVWPTQEGGVNIVNEHASTVVVSYDPQTGEAEAALRRWRDDDTWYANLYLPEGLYKFQSDGKSRSSEWKRRDVPGEAWPLPNLFNPIVPVVEFAVNPSLSGLQSSHNPLGEPRTLSRVFGSAHGEFERVLPVIDRVNTTIFAGLLSQAFASFPVRALIGDPINYRPTVDSDGEAVVDDSGNPFKAAVNRVIQIENPDGKLIQLPQSSLDHYIKFAESHIRHLAAVTKTPAHYLLGEMINISADAIRAAEAGLISKIRKHQRSLGNSHARVIRLALMAQGEEHEVPAMVKTKWRNPETRSQAEQADAAAKLAQILPWQALAEKILNATPQEITAWEAQRASDGLAAVLGQVPSGEPVG